MKNNNNISLIAENYVNFNSKYNNDTTLNNILQWNNPTDLNSPKLIYQYTSNFGWIFVYTFGNNTNIIKSLNQENEISPIYVIDNCSSGLKCIIGRESNAQPFEYYESYGGICGSICFAESNNSNLNNNISITNCVSNSTISYGLTGGIVGSCYVTNKFV